MAKFDHQLTLNPGTDRHQSWNTWFYRRYLPPKKLGVDTPRGFCLPHTWNIHPKPSNVYFFFLSSSEPLQTHPLDWFWRLIRHTSWLWARKCLLGVRKF